jgi:hypothetical protein
MAATRQTVKSNSSQSKNGFLLLDSRETSFRQTCLYKAGHALMTLRGTVAAHETFPRLSATVLGEFAI